MYKVGCRGCDNLDYTPYLCVACEQEAKSVDVSKLMTMIEHIRDTMFPNIGETLGTLNEENDMKMKDLTKRGRDNENDEAKIAKNPRK